MEDLLSYSISDFLMYSPDVYYRLLGRYNDAVWPMQYAAFALSIAVAWMIYWPRRWSGPLVWLCVALGWGWTAAVYFYGFYATISWAAPYFAALFMLEAVLLAGAGFAGKLVFSESPRNLKLVGLVLFLLVLFLTPWLSIFEGRALGQDEMVWLTPDATAMATFCLLLAASKSHWLLYVAPITWAALNGALVWAMESPTWWLMPSFAALAVSGALYKRYSPHWAR